MMLKTFFTVKALQHYFYQALFLVKDYPLSKSPHCDFEFTVLYNIDVDFIGQL